MGIEKTAARIQQRAADLLEDVGELGVRLGLVEVEVHVGEEPQEGVEFEVSSDGRALGATHVRTYDDGTAELLYVVPPWHREKPDPVEWKREGTRQVAGEVRRLP